MGSVSMVRGLSFRWSKISGKALHNQLVLAVEVAVEGSGGNLRQLADVLDAHPLQTVPAHGLHCCEYNPHFGVIQSNRLPFKPSALFRLIIHPPISLDKRLFKICSTSVKRRKSCVFDNFPEGRGQNPRNVHKKFMWMSRFSRIHIL